MCKTLIKYVVLFFMSSSLAHAVVVGYPKEDEIPLLPPYCKVKLNHEQGPGWNQWAATLGDAFGHVHHYCAGLTFINRYNKSWGDKEGRKFYLQSAKGEMDYMISHVADHKASILMPEIFLQRGKIFLLMKMAGNAFKDFEKAIELKPDYNAPYLALSDFYKENGDKGKAKAVLEKGLQHSPNSRSLQRRYLELGGKLSDLPPMPVVPVEAPAAPPVATEPMPEPVTNESAPVTVSPSGEPLAQPQVDLPTNP